MTVVEAPPHTEPALPYVIELARTLETYSDLASANDLDTNDIASLLVTLTRASEFAQTEVGRLGLLAREKGVGPHMSSRSTGEWLAHQTRTAPSSAHRLLRHAETAQRFSAFYFAQDSGRISGDHIEQVSRVWRKHPSLEDALSRDQQLLADTAVQLSPWEFGNVMERWLIYMQPDKAADDYAAKEDARHFGLGFDLDNNLHFEGRLDPIAGEGFARLVERRAQELFYEDWALAVEENQNRATPVAPSVLQLRRTHAQRRADALVSLVIDGSSTPADAQRPEPLILLGVDEDTITDVVEEVLDDIEDDETVEPTVDLGPLHRAFDPKRRCETGRGTPIPPRVMLTHFLTDRIRRIVFDNNGVIINAGRATRLFTPTQRDLLKFRDKSCRFPGCTIGAHRCEADHFQAFTDDGRTDLVNGHMLCRHHHRLKTRGRFFVTRNKDGTVSFYTPLGVLLT